ncbi:MAG: hypothetical protein V4487_07850 [Chlamydiota bacterium]
MAKSLKIFPLILSLFPLWLSAISVTGPTTIFPIDPMQRGLNIAKMVATLTTAPYNIPQSEVAIQTLSTTPFPYASYVVNGLIPYVQTISLAPYDTLLIVKYVPPGASPQYLVVPIELISEVIYSPVTIPATGFTSSFANGVIPFFSIDPVKRAADIQSIATTLLTSAPYKTATSKVGILTTLSGPFFLPLQNGLIYNVQSVTLMAANDTLLLIKYLSTQFVSSTIVVAAEQVQQVVYFPQ